MDINPNIPYFIEKEGRRIVLSPINDDNKRDLSMPFSILKHCESMLHEVEDDFVEFCSKYDQYVVGHGDRFYEQVCFEDIPFSECSDYSLCLNVVNKKVDWFRISSKQYDRFRFGL